jgi:hypothetical protein
MAKSTTHGTLHGLATAIIGKRVRNEREKAKQIASADVPFHIFEAFRRNPTVSRGFGARSVRLKVSVSQNR